MIITRFTRHTRTEVDRPDPIHYVVKFLGGRSFAGYCKAGDELIPIDAKVVRNNQLDAQLDCILSGQRTLDLCPGVQSFTVEDRPLKHLVAKKTNPKTSEE